MKEHILTKIAALMIASLIGVELGFSQETLLGGPCEGCEAVFEFGNLHLTPVDTLPEFNSEGTKIKVSGTVFQQDGKTPAEGVILYIYQTNEEGVYPKKGNETGWARRHGYLRGWAKTGRNGAYTFYTQKPHFYGNEPAHIHLTILEPDGSYYWLGAFLFEGDSNLSDKQVNNPMPRGGSNGIMSLNFEDHILTGKRDIILRKNL